MPERATRFSETTDEEIVFALGVDSSLVHRVGLKYFDSKTGFPVLRGPTKGLRRPNAKSSQNLTTKSAL